MPAEPDSPAPVSPRSATAGPELPRPAAALTGAADPSASLRAKSNLERLLAYRLFLLLALTVLTLDQASKLWIASRLPYGVMPFSPEAITVVHGFFYLIHVGNTGAAWSLFAGQSVALAMLAAATLGAIGFWRRPLGLRQKPVQIAFGLLCGGITGNLIDRLAHGRVTDFIDLHFGPNFPAMFNPYPTFNIADSGICVGTILYVIHSLRTPN